MESRIRSHKRQRLDSRGREETKNLDEHIAEWQEKGSQRGLDQFPDDILMHVFSYCGSGPRSRRHGEQPPQDHTSITESDVALLFRTIGRVSKFYQHLCNRYVRNVPIDVEDIVNATDFLKLTWLCRKRAKIKSCSLFKLGADLQVSCALFLLSSCDLSDFVGVSLVFEDKIEKSFDYDKTVAYEAGIPEEFINVAMGTDVKNAQYLVHKTLSEKVHCIQHLTLFCYPAYFYLPLVQGLSSHLENLCLHFDSYQMETESDFEIYKEQHDVLGEIISSMPHLQYLHLDNFVGASIRSTSIETLSISGTWILEECNCPLLTDMDMSVRFNSLCPALLSKFTNQIESLAVWYDILHERTILRERPQFPDNEGDEIKTHSIRRLNRIIEDMRNLESLRISNANFPMSIKSKTLKRINTGSCKPEFLIRECICPSLELLKCKYSPDLRIAHLEPVDKQRYFGGEENKRSSTLRVADCEEVCGGFVGLDVPETCTLNFKRGYLTRRLGLGAF